VQQVHQKEKAKLGREMGSFGNLHSVDSDTEEQPQIRAGFAPNNKGKDIFAKIVFYRDTDVLQHPFEQHAGRWASFFSNKLS